MTDLHITQEQYDTDIRAAKAQALREAAEHEFMEGFDEFYRFYKEDVAEFLHRRADGIENAA